VTALALAGVPLIAGGGAQAASVSLSYDCTSSLNATHYAFSAVVDTNAPATLGSGLTTLINVTSDVTAPADLVALLNEGGIASVDGTSQSTGTVNGVARASTLTIPRTPVPLTGTMQVVGSGAGGSITGGDAGSTILLGADNFTATLKGYNTAGTEVTPAGGVLFTCALAPSTGQNVLVDPVSVVPAPTTTALSFKPSPIELGDSTTVSAQVSRAGGNQKPAGTIVFTYAGKTYPVTVKGGKASVALPAALTMGANPVTAVFTPTDKNLATSQAAASLTVTRGSTATTATAVYRDRRDRLVGKALVEAVHGTDVAGQVKLKLKRDGTLIRTAVVSLNAKDKAKKVFKNIRKPGTYVVVAKYLGSSTLKRSKDTANLTLP
jgi:hypothetical protein